MRKDIPLAPKGNKWLIYSKKFVACGNALSLTFAFDQIEWSFVGEKLKNGLRCYNWETTWPRAKMWQYANFRRVSFYNLCIQAFSYAFVAEGQAWNILFCSTASYVSEIVFTLIFIQFIITVWCFRLILHVGIVIISILFPSCYPPNWNRFNCEYCSKETPPRKLLSL